MDLHQKMLYISFIVSEYPTKFGLNLQYTWTDRQPWFQIHHISSLQKFASNILSSGSSPEVYKLTFFLVILVQNYKLTFFLVVLFQKLTSSQKWTDFFLVLAEYGIGGFHLLHENPSRPSVFLITRIEDACNSKVLYLETKNLMSGTIKNDWSHICYTCYKFSSKHNLIWFNCMGNTNPEFKIYVEISWK